MSVLSLIKKCFAQSVPAATKGLAPASATQNVQAHGYSIFRCPVRKVARGLRYLNLPNLIGAKVTIQSNESADSDFLAIVGDYADHARIEPRLISIGGGTHCRYGFLDIELRGKSELLSKEAESGIQLLMSLGFISRKADGRPFLWPCDFDQMAEDIEKRETHLLLIMVDEGFDKRERVFPPDRQPGLNDQHIPQFPVHFQIADACLANSAHVWIWKHFYW
jgi:hypothetical protein